MATQTAPQNTINRDDKSMADHESVTSVSGSFECNICLDSVQDPVVTLCGHLYCWPCIYKWIHHHQNTNSSETLQTQKAQCPICKNEVSQKTIVPLYGPGQTTNTGTKETAPSVRNSVIPPRPSTPRYQRLVMPAAQPHIRRGYRQHAPSPLAMPGGGGGGGGLSVVVPSPTIGMLGEMVSGRILGELGSPLFATPNSYNIVGMSSRRERWQTTQVDRFLSRIYIFLCCGIILSLLVFI